MAGEKTVSQFWRNPVQITAAYTGVTTLSLNGMGSQEKRATVTHNVTNNFISKSNVPRTQGMVLPHGFTTQPCAHAVTRGISRDDPCSVSAQDRKYLMLGLRVFSLHMQSFLPLQKHSGKLRVSVHSCDLRTWEVEAGGSGVQRQPQLHIGS